MVKPVKLFETFFLGLGLSSTADANHKAFKYQIQCFVPTKTQLSLELLANHGMSAANYTNVHDVSVQHLNDTNWTVQ